MVWRGDETMKIIKDNVILILWTCFCVAFLSVASYGIYEMDDIQPGDRISCYDERHNVMEGLDCIQKDDVPPKWMLYMLMFVMFFVFLSMGSVLNHISKPWGYY